MAARIVSTALLVATAALARTDLMGCTYYDSVVNPGHGQAYATRVWYVPESGELCELLDCGGGRAPPKTTVPGCGSYEGTETYSPRFLDVKKLGGQAPQTTAAAAVTTESSEAPQTTEAPATSSAASAGGDGEDEGEGEEESSGQPSQTSASSATSAASETTSTTTKPAELPSGSSSRGGSNETPAASSTSTVSVPDSAGAALTIGGGLGSWVAAAAGAAAYAGIF
jgi:hypothetical protein